MCRATPDVDSLLQLRTSLAGAPSSLPDGRSRQVASSEAVTTSEPQPREVPLFHYSPPIYVRSTFSSVLIPLLFDGAGLLSLAAHNAWVEDPRSNAWWEISVAYLQHNVEAVGLDDLYAMALASDYCQIHFQGENLSPDSVELFRLWRLDTQRITLRRALEILVLNRRFRYYIPGELQEALLLAFGRDEMAANVSQNLDAFRTTAPASSRRPLSSPSLPSSNRPRFSPVEPPAPHAFALSVAS